MNKELNRREYWTLSQVSQLFSEPQHRLIYFCEEGLVVPASQEGKGRGSSRRFSLRNLFEFALCLTMRDLHLPSPITVYVLKVLAEFEKNMASQSPGFKLPETILGKGKPDIRIIISDGRKLFFSLHPSKRAPQVFGGIEMKKTSKNAALDEDGVIEFLVKGGRSKDLKPSDFGYPEGSRLGRTEISLLFISQELSDKINQTETV